MSSILRVDGIRKLEGKTKYVDDYTFPAMLHGAIICSTIHKGKIIKIQYPDKFNPSDFIICSASDIPGLNIVPEPVSDSVFLSDGEVRYMGQPILCVAHADKQMLQEFIRDTKIVYEKYQKELACTNYKKCLENEANAFGRAIEIDHGKKHEIDDSWIHLKKTYYTPHQEQAYLETQGMIANYHKASGTMNILGSMQCPYFVKEAVEQIMGDAVSKVIVEVAEGVGGAFGGKEDFPNNIAGFAALLSYKSNCPVKIILDRNQDMIITTKRHPARVEIESYVDPDTKKIKKMSIDYRLDAGCFQTLSPVVLSRGVLHATGVYACDDVYIMGRLFRSNTPPNGAFRGFGAPQAIFAIESHIEDLAALLNAAPDEFRELNLLTNNDKLPSTQMLDTSPLYECWNELLKESDFRNKYKEFNAWNKAHKIKKGIGLSLTYHGGGYTGNGEKVLASEVKITLMKNKTVEVFVSNVDMGQGCSTTLAQRVAEGLQYPVDKVIVRTPDTSKTPNSGPTVASRTIYVVGKILFDLAKDIRKQIGDPETYFETEIELPVEFNGKFTPDPNVVFDEETYKGIGYRDYSWAACAVEISYDPDLFMVKVDKIWNVLDIGKVVNPSIAEGQVAGAVVQGIGYGTTEITYKPGAGKTSGLSNYVVPIIQDAPDIHIKFVNTDCETAKGLGEIPMNYPAPAVRNALKHAAGITLDEIPLLPELIFDEWSKNEKK